MRRAPVIAALLSALASATPAWAAFARVEIPASAPMAAPSASFGAATAALPAPSPALSAAPAAPALAPAFVAPSQAAQVLAAPPELAAAPAVAVAQPAVKNTSPGATISLETAVRIKPSDAGRLFDAAPAAPDFAALSPVRAPLAPSPWTPSAVLLKPVAAAVNAWNSARYRKRLAHPRLEERVTTEEHGLRESLSELHAAVSSGRFQDALAAVAEFFQTRAASNWYLANPEYRPYRTLAFDYMRFAERAVLKAYGRAHARGGDDVLIAEARDAARAGRIAGRAWRPTAIQEKDSNFCVQNALFNAIAASVGFARPTSIGDFVAASRAALNRPARLDSPAGPAEIAALARSLDISLGRRDVDEGMGSDSLAEWTSLLGMRLAPRGPPAGDDGWSALLSPDHEVLLTLRMFHPKYVHSSDLAALRGHDHMVLHHEVYLLGAFDSPSLGARLYLLQDSGSGRTLMATAEELTALVKDAQVLRAAGPVRLPQAP